MTMIKPGMEGKELTQKQILSLVEKAEDFKISKHHCDSYYGRRGNWNLECSLKELDMEIKLSMGLFSDCYSVRIKRNNNLIGNTEKLSEKKEDGKKLKIIYDNAFKVIEKKYWDDEKRESENEKKARKEDLRYARGLLK